MYSIRTEHLSYIRLESKGKVQVGTGNGRQCVIMTYMFDYHLKHKISRKMMKVSIRFYPAAARPCHTIRSSVA